jgi:hypothetical protein
VAAVGMTTLGLGCKDRNPDSGETAVDSGLLGTEVEPTTQDLTLYCGRLDYNFYVAGVEYKVWLPAYRTTSGVYETSGDSPSLQTVDRQGGLPLPHSGT